MSLSPGSGRTCAESTRHRVSALKQPNSCASLSCPPRRWLVGIRRPPGGKGPLKASKRGPGSKLITLLGCGWRRHRVPDPRPVPSSSLRGLRCDLSALNGGEPQERQIYTVRDRATVLANPTSSTRAHNSVFRLVSALLRQLASREDHHLANYRTPLRRNTAIAGSHHHQHYPPPPLVQQPPAIDRFMRRQNTPCSSKNGGSHAHQARRDLLRHHHPGPFFPRPRKNRLKRTKAGQARWLHATCLLRLYVHSMKKVGSQPRPASSPSFINPSLHRASERETAARLFSHLTFGPETFAPRPAVPRPRSLSSRSSFSLPCLALSGGSTPLLSLLPFGELVGGGGCLAPWSPTASPRGTPSRTSSRGDTQIGQEGKGLPRWRWRWRWRRLHCAVWASFGLGVGRENLPFPSPPA